MTQNKLTQKIKEQKEEEFHTFEEKIKDCFRKINIKNEKITLGDLLRLQELR